MSYILKMVRKSSPYQYFVQVGGREFTCSPVLPCKRHYPEACRCRWYGDGIVRGTKAEATRYATKAEATKVLRSRQLGTSSTLQDFEAVAVAA